MKVSTVCYLKYENDWLMLFRNKKEQDVNHGKWIGVGGKLEKGESPVEGARREIWEETRLDPPTLKICGILTFLYEDKEDEYIFVCQGEANQREFGECSEGQLAWIPQEEMMNLPMWPGDKLFLPSVLEESPFFSLKLTYDKEDRMVEAVLE